MFGWKNKTTGMHRRSIEMSGAYDGGLVVLTHGLMAGTRASDMYGDPFAIVPAHALDGVRGITRAVPPHRIELIAVYFADEQVIYAEGGALIHCPANITALDKFIDAQPSSYDVLNTRDAAFLAECLAMEDQMLASGGHVDGQIAAHC
mgnify:CR=1 FL=1